jgi:RNA polymerase sigma-70 factor (ECF subfamily)
MSPPRPADVTAMLQAWRRGQRDAADELMPLVYDQLRAIAARYLRRERPDHTLEPTALVHEVYLRLIDQKAAEWQDRAHFFAIAAKLMRRILVDHARGRLSDKRGRGTARVSITGVEVAAELTPDLVALDDALRDLAAFDPDRATLVELRYFGGLTVEETAEVMGRSTATVVRQWRTARAWLYDQLRAERPGAA